MPIKNTENKPDSIYVQKLLQVPDVVINYMAKTVNATRKEIRVVMMVQTSQIIKYQRI